MELPHESATKMFLTRRITTSRASDRPSQRLRHRGRQGKEKYASDPHWHAQIQTLHANYCIFVLVSFCFAISSKHFVLNVAGLDVCITGDVSERKRVYCIQTRTLRFRIIMRNCDTNLLLECFLPAESKHLGPQIARRNAFVTEDVRGRRSMHLILTGTPKYRRGSKTTACPCCSQSTSPSHRNTSCEMSLVLTRTLRFRRRMWNCRTNLLLKCF